MAIPSSDLNEMMAQGSIETLRRVKTNTAGGKAIAYRVRLEVRVLTLDAMNVLIPWHVVSCNCYDDFSFRLFRGVLEKNCFVCNHPHRQHLYAARTKDLLRRMPKK
jgi:hypothetical protein